MEEKPKLKRDWEGRYVRLRHRMEVKAGIIFEAGEVMRVERNHGGLSLTGIRRCPHCERGFRHYIRGVREGDVELLPKAYQPDGDQR